MFTETRDGRTRAVPVKRIGRAHYAGALTLDKDDALAVTAHLRNGKRMHSVFEI